MDYKIGPEKEYSVLLDYAQAFGGGDNTLNAYSIGGGYTFMDLIKNFDLPNGSEQSISKCANFPKFRRM